MGSEIEGVLVIGATGNVGRHVVEQLVARGVRVRALTRNPKLANLPPEVDLARGDLAAPELDESVLKDISAAFLVWALPATNSFPYVLDLLAKHARRIVFLSSSAIRDDLAEQPNLIARAHAEIEGGIASAASEWTFLRPDGFASNAINWWGAQIRRGDVVRWPYGNAAMAPIHEKDMAAVAVHALLENGHHGRKYVLTGPESLTFAQQVQIIADVIGRRLQFEELSREAARQQFPGSPPPAFVEVLLDVFSSLTEKSAEVSPTVAEVTGAPAHSFREWVADHVADFR
jgi:uncharacterized protein YbjT (DUF2867 family)